MKRIIATLTVFVFICCSLPMVSLAEETNLPSGMVESNETNKLHEANEVNEATNVRDDSTTSAITENADEKHENVEAAEDKPVTYSADENSSYVGEVTFMGQWVNESSAKKNTKRSFAKATDIIGEPEPNPGTLRSLSKIFLGWSDVEPTENGKLPEGAKLFSSKDSISVAFPNGIPSDAKLYAVYFELNKYGSPFTNFDTLSLMKIASKFSDLANQNKVNINNHIAAEDVLPDTDLSEEIKDDKSRKIVDYYSNKDDSSTINEVVLNSEFEMNKIIAMLVYKNPVGSNANRPILSFDYNKRYDTTGEFNSKDGKEAQYTYMDLVVSLDSEIKLPETLYLDFSSYSWRPLYVFGDDKEQLNIINPATGANLGHDKTSFASLVSNTNPITRFAVETKGKHSLTIRVVLREGQNEKISEASIAANPGMSKIDKITENMTLKSLSKAELKSILPGLSEEEYNAKVLRVENSVAKALAETDAEKSLKINGHVTGHVVAWAGSVSIPFIGNTQLKSDTSIKKVESDVEHLISYIKKTYNVFYTFVSATEGKELPDEVTALKPQDLSAQEDGTNVSLFDFEDVKDKDGTWSFIGWFVDKDGKYVAVTDESVIEHSDLRLVGKWTFVKNEETGNEPKPTPDPTPQPQKDSEKSTSNNEKDNKSQVSPETGESSDILSYVTLALISVVGLGYMSIRRKEN